MSEPIRSYPDVGSEPARLDMVKPGTSDVLTSTRPGDWKEKLHVPGTVDVGVQSFPVVKQSEVIDTTLVFHQAALGLLDSWRCYVCTDLQLFFSKMCRLKPEGIGWKTWVESVFEPLTGIAEDLGGLAIARSIVETPSVYQNFLTLVDMDLATAGFFDFCELMETQVAALVMQTTRPCEHVVLTQPMLWWSNQLPEIRRQGGRKIEVSPTDPKEYNKRETDVRRQQRLFFPGLTSLACQVMLG